MLGDYLVCPDHHLLDKRRRGVLPAKLHALRPSRLVELDARLGLVKVDAALALALRMPKRGEARELAKTLSKGSLPLFPRMRGMLRAQTVLLAQTAHWAVWLVRNCARSTPRILGNCYWLKPARIIATASLRPLRAWGMPRILGNRSAIKPLDSDRLVFNLRMRAGSMLRAQFRTTRTAQWAVLQSRTV